MKAIVRAVLSFVAVIAFAGVPSAAFAAQTPSMSSNDKMADERIENRLHADATLKSFDVDVAVNGGVATLTGKVASQAEKVRAERLAKVNGVTRVDNQIVVDPSTRTTKGTTGAVKEKAKDAAEKTKEGAEYVGEKTKAGAGKVADKTKEGLSKTGEVITDGWITSRIHAAFVPKDELKGSDINVDTNDHVVTLRGTVPNAAARAKAIEVAKGVEGVHRVIDQMTIGPKR